MAVILRVFDLLRVSIRQVLRHYRRYMGIVLAISIGTCGFIVVLTAGRDMKHTLNQDLDMLGGATRLKVTFAEGEKDRNQVPVPRYFRQEAIDAVRNIPGVQNVSVAVLRPGQAVSSVKGREHRYVLLGVDAAFWEVNGFSPEEGEFFDSEAVGKRRKVCVLGSNLAVQIFGHQDVVGLTIPVDHDVYIVSGVLGGVGVGDRSNFMFIPTTTAQDRIQGCSLPALFYVRCRTMDDVAPVSKAIGPAIQYWQPGSDIFLEVAWAALHRVQKIVWWVETFIYLSIVATLVLGGMGIWNGMMASVQSRTREIGLKKAIGAEDSDILIQFLAEALFLSLGSSLVGIGFGRAAIHAVSHILNSPPSEDLFLLSVAISIIFSVLLGVGAGFTPSLIASRKEVVLALRYE